MSPDVVRQVENQVQLSRYAPVGDDVHSVDRLVGARDALHYVVDAVERLIAAIPADASPRVRGEIAGLALLGLRARG